LQRNYSEDRIFLFAARHFAALLLRMESRYGVGFARFQKMLLAFSLRGNPDIERPAVDA
jgi:hypothetical protein